MISDSCSTFLQTKDINSLIADLKHYLNDKTFGKYYSGDVRIRCEWLILNHDKVTFAEVYNQARILLDTLDTSPPLEKVTDLYDNWQFRN